MSAIDPPPPEPPLLTVVQALIEPAIYILKAPETESYHQSPSTTPDVGAVAAVNVLCPIYAHALPVYIFNLSSVVSHQNSPDKGELGAVAEI